MAATNFHLCPSDHGGGEATSQPLKVAMAQHVPSRASLHAPGPGRWPWIPALHRLGPQSRFQGLGHQDSLRTASPR